MQLNKFIEGLAIFAQYYDDPEGYSLGAEHDIIYIYPTDKPLPEKDLKRIFELGFFQPEVDTGDEDLPKVEQYDSEEGWGAFV